MKKLEIAAQRPSKFALNGATFLALVFVSSAAQSCLPTNDSRLTPAARLHQAKQVVSKAYAIIDGEVVRSSNGSSLVLLYAHRTFKGPEDRWFEVSFDSCFDFDRMNERDRWFIFKDTEGRLSVKEWFVDRHYLDRVLRSDRKRDYPYFAGRP